MVIPSMAWPSGWEQHLLVPQQSARNAKGDKSGHLFITCYAAPKCHKSPWLFVCCEPAGKKCLNRNCKTFWSNVRKTLIDQVRIMIITT